MIRRAYAIPVLLLGCMAGVPAQSQASEYVLNDGGSGWSARQLVLSCDRAMVSVSFRWALPLGSPEAYLRHLFLPGMGDRHVFLKIRRGGRETGTANDAEAKDLLQLMQENLRSDRFSVEVFPGGRDEATGEWESAWFDRTQFSASVTKVAKECNWNLGTPTKHVLKTAEPGYEPGDL